MANNFLLQPKNVPCEFGSCNFSGAFVLVGRSSSTKRRSGKSTLSYASATCYSSLRRQSTSSHPAVTYACYVNEDRSPLTVSAGAVVILMLMLT
jgi:hypothetical protein